MTSLCPIAMTADKPRLPPKRLPICSATVEILGSHWPQTAIAWAGFYWDRAELRDGPHSHHLRVPWAHPDDPPWEDDDAWYRVRAKDGRYRFARASNGNWVLELAP